MALSEAVPNAETMASLDDLASPGPALVSTAARLANDLGQVFGIAEMPQLSREGELRRPYWSRDNWPHLEVWARQHDITLSQAVLPN